MPTATKKFTAATDAALYDEFVSAAKQNGQSQCYVLEQALTLYLHNVAPSQHLVHREVMEEIAQSAATNRDLLKRLAK